MLRLDAMAKGVMGQRLLPSAVHPASRCHTVRILIVFIDVSRIDPLEITNSTISTIVTVLPARY